MAKRQRNVSELSHDLENNPATRMGLHIIAGRDGRPTTEAIFGDDACRWVYSGLIPVKTAQDVLLKYHGEATIYRRNGEPVVIRSQFYGGRVVGQQQKSFA